VKRGLLKSRNIKMRNFLGLFCLVASQWMLGWVAEEIVRSSAAFEPGGRYLVAAPLVDLRREPKPALPGKMSGGKYEIDPLQETQLIFCEEIRLRDIKGSWARVEAVEQMEFTHNNQWEGYPGWVPWHVLQSKPPDFSPNAVVISLYSQLYDRPTPDSFSVEIPFGAKIQVNMRQDNWARVFRPGQNDGWMHLEELRFFEDFPENDQVLRKSILESARLFMNEPYYWGGRSSHRGQDAVYPTGVDCSGLVHLAYRSIGIQVPRDSHEQFMRSRPIPRSDLRVGDLIFLSRREKPHRIFHVLMSAGGEKLLEAVYEFNTVRTTTFKQKVGRALKKIPPSGEAGDLIVRFGRALPE